MGEVDESIRDVLADLQRGREALVDQQHLRGGRGGGTTGGVSDDWKDSVDRQLGQLHDDFRRIAGWLIAAIAAPLLAVFGLYVYTGNKFDRVDAKFEAVNEKIAALKIEQAKTDAKIDVLLERTAPKPAR